MVIWRDANFYREAIDIPDGDYLVKTLGWILATDYPWLTIASERTPDGERAATRIALSDVVDVLEFAIPATQSPWQDVSAAPI
jgi:hypothetical protein